MMDHQVGSYYIDYRDHLSSDLDHPFKATLAQSENMLVGVTRLETGQNQPVHIHIGEDKTYLVMEGEGYFQVGDEFKSLGPGMLAWAPASLPHGVVNTGAEPLVLLFVISPAPGH